MADEVIDLEDDNDEPSMPAVTSRRGTRTKETASTAAAAAGSADAPFEIGDDDDEVTEAWGPPPRRDLAALQEIATQWRGSCVPVTDAERLKELGVNDESHAPLMWKCARGHEWECMAEDVALQRFWCPHWKCLRGVHPLRRGIAETALPPAASRASPSTHSSTGGDPAPVDGGLPRADQLLQMAKASQCILLVRQPSAGVDVDPVANAHAVQQWRCPAGCEFHQSLAEGFRVPGWCPKCMRNGEAVLRELSNIAAQHDGQCVRIIGSSGFRPLQQLRWHRDDQTLMEMRCARKHPFAASIDVLRRNGWCPTCEAEQAQARRRQEEEEYQRHEEEQHRQQQQQQQQQHRQQMLQEQQRQRYEQQQKQQKQQQRRDQHYDNGAGSSGAGSSRSARGKAPMYNAYMTEEEAAAEQARLFANANAKRKRAQQQRMPPPPAPAPAPMVLPPPPELDKCELSVAVQHVLQYRHAPPLYTLGLARGLEGDHDAIRKQYKMLARRLHPDKCDHESANEAFGAIMSAFQKLAPRPA